MRSVNGPWGLSCGRSLPQELSLSVEVAAIGTRNPRRIPRSDRRLLRHFMERRSDRVKRCN